MNARLTERAFCAMLEPAMLIMRLQRIGKKHQPSYRLVVAERRSKMAAPPTEDLGAYNPSAKTATFNKERVLHWLGVGAHATPTVHNLLVKEGIVSKAKIAIKIRKKAASAEKDASAAPVPGAASAAESAAPTPSPAA